MIRRSPTRIDLKLDDLLEFEAIRKERENKKEAEKQPGFNPPAWGKVPPTELQERIGYVPPPSQAPSLARPNI